MILIFEQGMKVCFVIYLFHFIANVVTLYSGSVHFTLIYNIILNLVNCVLHKLKQCVDYLSLSNLLLEYSARGKSKSGQEGQTHPFPIFTFTHKCMCLAMYIPQWNPTTLYLVT